MNINIDTTEKENEYLIVLNGELDVYTAPELQKVLDPIRQSGSHNIKIDLTDVSYMDSTGLGIFVGTLKELNQHDRELRVTGVSNRILRLFEITGLRDLMHINEVSEVE
ncbi:anti-sigma factor antagonist [Salinicoccus sp. HZC-1]|uniref:anti-sigma factor antagonist n=1 Tax=Salinicoccus sp. HZC-1 TaxID=3385497 RepID=UPI00398B2CD7